MFRHALKMFGLSSLCRFVLSKTKAAQGPKYMKQLSWVCPCRTVVLSKLIPCAFFTSKFFAGFFLVLSQFPPRSFQAQSKLHPRSLFCLSQDDPYRLCLKVLVRIVHLVKIKTLRKRHSFSILQHKFTMSYSYLNLKLNR